MNREVLVQEVLERDCMGLSEDVVDDALSRVDSAIVLAGGDSRRMSGQDKLAMTMVGQTLLDHAIEAVEGVGIAVVVGPERPTTRVVRWTREDPPGGGPVAGIAAGLAATTDDERSGGLVAVVAGDMPFAGSALGSLAQTLARAETDVAIGVGSDGRDQPLLAVWRYESLRVALEPWAEVSGRSVRSLFVDAAVSRVLVANSATLDCDEPADLGRLAEFARHSVETDDQDG